MFCSSIRTYGLSSSIDPVSFVESSSISKSESSELSYSSKLIDGDSSGQI